VAITSTPADPTNQTSASFSFGDTEAGASFLCQLDRSAFSACSSPVIYLGRLSQGSHRFSVTAQDAAGNQSNAASFSWIVDTKAPPKPVLDAAEPDEPDHSQLHIHGSSEKRDLLLLARCNQYSACSSPQSYSGLSLGGHTFSVKAQDAAGNQSVAKSFTWTLI
jgi:large repetitive protein